MSLFSFMTLPRLRVNRATTPGRGIYHDGRTLARGFQDGNLLWRSCTLRHRHEKYVMGSEAYPNTTMNFE